MHHAFRKTVLDAVLLEIETIEAELEALLPNDGSKVGDYE